MIVDYGTFAEFREHVMLFFSEYQNIPDDLAVLVKPSVWSGAEMVCSKIAWVRRER